MTVKFFPGVTADDIAAALTPQPNLLSQLLDDAKRMNLQDAVIIGRASCGCPVVLFSHEDLDSAIGLMTRGLNQLSSYGGHVPMADDEIGEPN